MKSIDFSSTIVNVIGTVIIVIEKFLGGNSVLPTDCVRKSANVALHCSAAVASVNSPVETIPTMISCPSKRDPYPFNKNKRKTRGAIGFEC